ncbi:DUF1028 domain-containing protein [Aquibaculum arenosum]|uniref:DUF1028 domain-containing protein n=1 Tax=Aquibaculum arenosum TaxID=3032591 RepID=A0ABT5YK16_9PROT|nr:DUF1028 domain-containing protein [Fodinicurvata sp. CAU 1616]MDF2095269.1 DUF1028 domain-containing protein [Fodinicurvata sp. CAU 1616]
MTFSIVARCPRSGQFGIAAATAMPAVGKLLTHAQSGVGAVATQARINPYLGIDGLALLAQGVPAPDVIEALKPRDPRMDLRQVAVIDAAGRAAAFTGEGCPAWSGHITGEGYSFQGNRLAGANVLERARERFLALESEALPERLVEALASADAGGGDLKGERSATLYVVDSEDYPLWDIRVDEHPRPIEELRRLLQVFARDVVPHIKRMPTRENPAGEAGEEVA